MPYDPLTDKRAGKIRLVIAWFDLWIGAYWNSKNRTLYVFPVPCVGFRIRFGKSGSEHP